MIASEIVALFCIPNGRSLPSRLRLTLRPLIHTLKRHFTFATHTSLFAGRTLLLEVTHQGIAWHIQDVTFLPLPQVRTELSYPELPLSYPTELVIGCDPTVGQIGQGSIQQIQCDLLLLLELDLRGT